jgi:hypothetical protein
VAFSKLLSLLAYDILYDFLHSLLEVGGSMAVESNFKVAVDSSKLQALLQRYDVKLFQVHCHASREILLKRFKRRRYSLDRHPGHLDHLTFGDIQASLACGDYVALETDGLLFEIDTSDFLALDYPSLIAALRAAIESCSREAIR